jgi:starvation-inducible outer membrane lipoprotein
MVKKLLTLLLVQVVFTLSACASPPISNNAHNTGSAVVDKGQSDYYGLQR